MDSSTAKVDSREREICGEGGRFYDVGGHNVRKWRDAYLARGLRGI
jgi:hypothetical protein